MVDCGWIYRGRNSKLISQFQKSGIQGVKICSKLNIIFFGFLNHIKVFLYLQKKRDDLTYRYFGKQSFTGEQAVHHSCGQHMYKYVTWNRTGQEYKKMPVHREFWLVGVQFSRPAGIFQPKIVRYLMLPGTMKPCTARHF